MHYTLSLPPANKKIIFSVFKKKLHLTEITAVDLGSETIYYFFL